MCGIPLATITVHLRRLPLSTIIIHLGIQLILRLLRPRLPTFGHPKALIPEHLIHIFQTFTRRLGVEKVYNRHENGIEDCPDDVKPPAEIIDGIRGDVYDYKVGEPVRTDAQGDTFVAGAKRHDLGSVHPADGEDTPGEDVEEEEGEGYEYPSCL